MVSYHNQIFRYFKTIFLSVYVLSPRRALARARAHADDCGNRRGVIYCGRINADEGATAIPSDSHGLHRQDTFTVSIIKASRNVTLA